MFSVYDMVAESNRIEGIHREPSRHEIAEHTRFVSLGAVTIADLRRFVSVYQPDAKLRNMSGLNVRVADYTPIEGGVAVTARLCEILEIANDVANAPSAAWAVHVAYETLHPFTDGNGRSGRVLWYWMMRDSLQARLGFLHAFYYQTLSTLQHGATDVSKMPGQSLTTGDKGQRYEVTQVTSSGSMVWGWTDKIDGGALARAVRSHPNTIQVRVRDRIDGGEVVIPSTM